jgi:predicted site-specific integrase-resolvase
MNDVKKDDLMIEPLVVNAKTAARMIGVCERTLRTLSKQGDVPVVKIASRVLYRPEDLTEFIRLRTKRELSE